jgi:hypothetical protein
VIVRFMVGASERGGAAREAESRVSPSYWSHCRPRTGAASENCRPVTGATVSTMNRSRTLLSVQRAPYASPNRTTHSRGRSELCG